MKKCSKCKEEKDFSEFHKNKRSVDGYQNQCKACRKTHADLTKEKKAKKDKEWYERNKEKQRAKVREYRQNNLEVCKERNRRYKKNNKGLINYLTSLKKKKVKQATPSWADKEKIKQIYLISAQKTKETGIQYHVDHIIPIKGELVSGLHVPENLQVITATENLKKNNKYLI